MSDQDFVFKMILVGDDGPVQERIVEQLGIEFFGNEDYMKTIGTEIHYFKRTVDDITVKTILWVLSTDAEFQSLMRAYYQNTSMIVLSIEECGKDSHPKFQKIVEDVFRETGPIPIALVADSKRPQDDEALKQLASKIDASQLILTLDDLDKLDEKVERLIRETLFTTTGRSVPYILSLLRAYGLPGAQNLESDTIIKAIRTGDYSSRIDDVVPTDELHEHLEAKRSSLFLDIEQLKDTENSVHIPEILESRTREIKEIWVNQTLQGKYDLRYLWLTAYGFEILRSVKAKLMVEEGVFQRIKVAFSKLGFELQVRGDNTYPEIEMSEELKSFVWDLVKKL